MYGGAWGLPSDYMCLGRGIVIVYCICECVLGGEV